MVHQPQADTSHASKEFHILLISILGDGCMKCQHDHQDYQPWGWWNTHHLWHNHGCKNESVYSTICSKQIWSWIGFHLPANDKKPPLIAWCLTTINSSSAAPWTMIAAKVGFRPRYISIFAKTTEICRGERAAYSLILESSWLAVDNSDCD